MIVPGPLAWTNIYGRVLGHTNVQTFTLITTPISVAASWSTGGAKLHYVLNGGASAYLGPFTVEAGDTLLWSIVNLTSGDLSGTVIVANASDGGAALDSFTYTVTGTE